MSDITKNLTLQDKQNIIVLINELNNDTLRKIENFIWLYKSTSNIEEQMKQVQKILNILEPFNNFPGSFYSEKDLKAPNYMIETNNNNITRNFSRSERFNYEFNSFIRIWENVQLEIRIQQIEYFKLHLKIMTQILFRHG
ncbi:hypothetical protein Hokovirus_1_349 [Hokovirus HKV1]|uniref:Uncharacterized protein n=1 Tax=Hokovirus HKV1 TaxID=1977638 RepID=A0A1V0SFH4_9VIRU|nr:hypothetical protein Hokovirus_1_349 [Hokovirus HKV1]